MAVLGLQLVVTMVMASCLSKLAPHYSFARWLLCNHLVRYLHPSNEELKTAAGTPKPKGKKDYKNQQKSDTFTVPKNVQVTLDTARVTTLDLINLFYYPEFRWLVDFSFCATVVYCITEVYLTVFPSMKEVNLSIVWCLLVILFSLKVLFSLTAMYFRVEDPGERILCITFGFFFMVTAMGIMLTSEETLEFGLASGHGNFSQKATDFLKEQGIESHGPASLTTLKVFLIFCSGILGSFMTFPGLRYSKMHSDALKYASPFRKVFLHINFLYPLLIICMWIKPAVKDYFIGKTGPRKILTDDGFESLKIYMIIIFCFLRFLLLTIHVQAHLNLAFEKITNLGKESGRITNTEYQKIVARVFYYCCVVALQYVAPLILLLFCSFCFKTLGNLSWTSTEVQEAVKLTSNQKFNASSITSSETLQETAAQLGLAITQLREIFSPIWYKGLFSYICWWINLSWFITSAFGMVYYYYFTTAT